ncbi:hypothetical protein LZD49_07140 [Dyadobacter sp. CY261]|uniref:hypothetical protein n=1 Tax=Dyadobacter sp. CY261 TaxID=2907203 RepID=UPI001F1B60FE|nr:hypothetical protein [Dyadobacter sp. CY261]MCF0070241.1 hypothetical protein [Dyadobacter sp. CY261]
MAKSILARLEANASIEKFSEAHKGIIVTAIVSTGGVIRREPDPVSENVLFVENGTAVRLLDYDNGYWAVSRDLITGFISEMFINETDDIKRYKIALKGRQNDLKQQLADNKASELRKKEEDRELLLQKIEKEIEVEAALWRKKMIGKYGKTVGQKVIDGYYWVGMSAGMARDGLGDPMSINKSVGNWGIHEQWVYPDMYLYFENGKLASYQNSQ